VEKLNQENERKFAELEKKLNVPGEEERPTGPLKLRSTERGQGQILDQHRQK
jgi:hypothetical protein